MSPTKRQNKLECWLLARLSGLSLIFVSKLQVLECRYQGPYSKHIIWFVTQNGPYKLRCYITLGWKSLLVTNAAMLLGPFIKVRKNGLLLI